MEEMQSAEVEQLSPGRYRYWHTELTHDVGNCAVNEGLQSPEVVQAAPMLSVSQVPLMHQRPCEQQADPAVLFNEQSLACLVK